MGGTRRRGPFIGPQLYRFLAARASLTNFPGLRLLTRPGFLQSRYLTTRRPKRGAPADLCVFSRSAHALAGLLGLLVRVHRGRRFKTIDVTLRTVGWRFGELARTRRHASFKSKVRSKRKKARTRKKSAMAQKLARIRLHRAGLVRRHAVSKARSFERALRRRTA